MHRQDDIRQPTDWQIHDAQHNIVVHLGGRMKGLETELDGTGGSSGPALPGEIWSIPAERKYASHASGELIEYVVLRVKPDALSQLQQAAISRHAIRPVSGVVDAFLHQSVRRILATLQSPDNTSAMMAEALSQTICLHVLSALREEGPLQHRDDKSGPQFSARITRQLQDQIHTRLDERLTLADLAATAGLTTHHFLIAFKRAFGTTPAQYIIQQRIRTAQYQLLHTRKDITTIALDTGFSSHSHLTARFTQQVGCSPNAYRASTRKFQIPSRDH